MKRSVQLLTGMVILIFAGLFYIKYQLKLAYTEIDKSDRYYAFDLVEDLSFSHVRIDGGSREHVTIQPGNSDAMYLHKRLSEVVTYTLNNDTLLIQFDKSQTLQPEYQENRWGNNDFASVMIQCKDIQSIAGHNASIGVDPGNSSTFNSRISGYSNLEIIGENNALRFLSVRSEDHSKFRINKNGTVKKLTFLDLHLTSESLAELYNIKADSSLLDLDSDSRISADATFFN